MTEEEVKAIADGEIETLYRVLRKTLAEVYVRGFMRGVASSGIKHNEVGASSHDATLDSKICKDEFPVRVWRTLSKMGIKTLGDLLNVSETTYLSQPSFGRRSLNVLREYVRQFGYELR